MEQTVDVTCPAGAAEGDTIAVTFGSASFDVHRHDGRRTRSSLVFQTTSDRVSCAQVTVPLGVCEGDVFSVVLPAGDQPLPPALDGVVARTGAAAEGADALNAALKYVLDALEDNDDSALDTLIDENCSDFAEWEAGGEARLEWHTLYERYLNECEGFIAEVLASLDVTVEHIFEHARAYSGSDERSQRLIQQLLAMADFEQFCQMMRDRHEILQIFNS